MGSTSAYNISMWTNVRSVSDFGQILQATIFSKLQGTNWGVKSTYFEQRDRSVELAVDISWILIDNTQVRGEARNQADIPSLQKLAFSVTN